MEATHPHVAPSDSGPVEPPVSPDVERSTAAAAPAAGLSLRAVAVGIPVGLVICITNIYFGLQIGMVNTMVVPSALVGFLVFRALGACLRPHRRPFTPAENVVLQTTATSLGGMPLTAGLVGVIPAMEDLTPAEEGGPFPFDFGQLILWSLGICVFGVIFAIPLRRRFIVEERLRFPSGSATAALLGFLYRDERINQRIQFDETIKTAPMQQTGTTLSPSNSPTVEQPRETGIEEVPWRKSFAIIIVAFVLSACLTVASFFLPVLSRLPIFGNRLATEWLWSFNLSLAFVGYGMIMNPVTVANILAGGVLGWAVLSPLAKLRGWAPGPVGDWDSGSQGWTIWVSLAVLIGDGIVTIGWSAYKSCSGFLAQNKSASLTQVVRWPSFRRHVETEADDAVLDTSSHNDETTPLLRQQSGIHGVLSRARPEPARSSVPTSLWLVVSSAFCVLSLLLLFGTKLPVYVSAVSLILAYPLAIITTYGLGETDASVATSISKVSMFLFARIIPISNPNATIITLAVGGITEAGVWQASDLMSDFKTAFLVDAAPADLFYAQLIGSVVGAIASSAFYRVFVAAFPIPGDVFRVPSAHLWLLTVHLVYGKGLPEGTWPFCVAAAVLSSFCALGRIAASDSRWKPFIPSGVAVAIGMFIAPAMMLPEVLGGLTHVIARERFHTNKLAVVLTASGFILGGGIGSVASLILRFLDF